MPMGVAVKIVKFVALFKWNDVKTILNSNPVTTTPI